MMSASAHPSVRPAALLYLPVQSGHFKILPRTSHASAPAEGSVANQVCGSWRISEALRYKAAVMKQLGSTVLWARFLSVYPPATILTLVALSVCSCTVISIGVEVEEPS